MPDHPHPQVAIRDLTEAIRLTTLALFMSTPSSPTRTAHSFSIAIGTDTTGDGESEGIYLSIFDPSNGTFGTLDAGADYGSSATFLALHPSLPLLYALGKSARYPEGSVAVFRIGDTLEFVAEATSTGSTPCHLAIDSSGVLLAVANYDDGTISTLTLDAGGLPWPAFSLRMTGSGPNRERQDGSHPHGVYFRGQTLHVPDLGLDRVHTWTLDPGTAKLEAENPLPWTSEPGAGPRHMAFSPDGRHAYVTHELGNAVSALDYDEPSGSFSTIHTLSTLPEGLAPENTTAEIAVHPNGRFVYVSNRGHDSIAVFLRDLESGKLTRMLVAPAGGKNPRHFAISPDGHWLLCAHQDTSTIAALPIDPESGMVGEAKAILQCPHPICVIFLPSRMSGSMAT